MLFLGWSHPFLWPYNKYIINWYHLISPEFQTPVCLPGNYISLLHEDFNLKMSQMDISTRKTYSFPCARSYLIVSLSFCLIRGFIFNSYLPLKPCSQSVLKSHCTDLHSLSQICLLFSTLLPMAWFSVGTTEIVFRYCSLHPSCQHWTLLYRCYPASDSRMDLSLEKELYNRFQPNTLAFINTFLLLSALFSLVRILT